MAPRRPPIDATKLPLGLRPRTVFVTGKGGVGKSTVSAALALAWRDAGARTLLVELDGHASAAALISSKKVGYEPVPLGPHLAATRITMLDALKEYARMRLKVKLVADRLVSNPVIDQFTQAAPGLPELLILGKLYSLASEVDSRKQPVWDAIVVDAPSTGHGLGLLNMAGVVNRMFPVGPIAAEAKRVDEFVRDASQTGVVLVALAEELPVTETLELHEQLRDQGVDVAATVLNSLLVDRFTDSEAATARAAAEQSNLPTHVVHALETVAWEHTRCVDQTSERHRLHDGLETGTCVLPFMFAPHLEPEHITALSQWLRPGGQEILQAQLAGATAGPAAAAAVHEAAAAVDGSTR